MTTQKSNNYSVAERINSDVNARVAYRSDLRQFGVPEFWQEANRIGDCEDYALLKRALLVKSGWPQDKLFLACCWVETGEYHCVLITETDKGFFVLDNRHPWPMQPKPLPYRWDKALKGDSWCELSF